MPNCPMRLPLDIQVQAIMVPGIVADLGSAC